jgi:hypothetical protein
VEFRLVEIRFSIGAGTDEWGLHRDELEIVCRRFGVTITVNAFAAGGNRVVQKYCLKTPQTGSMGEDFYAEAGGAGGVPELPPSQGGGTCTN